MQLTDINELWQLHSVQLRVGYQPLLKNIPLFFVMLHPPPLNLQTVQTPPPLLGNSPLYSGFS